MTTRGLPAAHEVVTVIPLTLSAGIANRTRDTPLAALADAVKIPSLSATDPVRHAPALVTVDHDTPYARSPVAASLPVLVAISPAAAVTPAASEAPKSALVRFMGASLRSCPYDGNGVGQVMVIGVPAGSSPKIVRAGAGTRTQPWLTWPVRPASVGQPCTATVPGPPPKVSSVSECAPSA